MKAKQAVFFILALAASIAAGTYRWGDSAHSIGLIKASGGDARHPSVLGSGESGYMLIATATVIPPYRGDVRVELEGSPPMDHRIYLSGPVWDLGIRRHPELRDNIIRDLRPMDRIALWVEMEPPLADPVCGMPRGEGFLSISHAGRDYCFCSPACAEAFSEDPGRYKTNASARGKYNLVFYDTKTGRPVLGVPVIFQEKGGARDAGHQH